MMLMLMTIVLVWKRSAYVGVCAFVCRYVCVYGLVSEVGGVGRLLFVVDMPSCGRNMFVFFHILVSH